MHPGEILKEQRKLAGLTQVDLAERSGLGLRFIREMEQGKPTIRLDKANEALNLFGYEIGAVPMTREA